MKLVRTTKNYLHLRQARKAAKKYGYPEKELKIIGVTGTDGKTSTVSLIYHILQSAGLKVGYVSTVEARIGNKLLDTGLHVTSPDPWVLPYYLRLMRDQGIEYVVLETTSMGLDQHRFGDIKFDAAVITNIREDHLDYHGSWENYAKSKFSLLRKLKDEGVAVLNADDRQSAEWLKAKSQELKQTVFVKWSSQNLATDIDFDFTGIKFKLANIPFSVPIIGTSHNLENVLQAVLLCESLLPLAEIKQALTNYRLPKGRLELMLTDPLKIIVDFAHTPAALEAALKNLRTIMPKGRRIISVFGCAGKRDRGRRRMGEISALYSDLTILTAEDPRNEKLYSINSEIFAYAKPEGAVMIARFRNHDDYALTGLGEIHAEAETAWKNEYRPFIAFDEDNKMSRRDAIELAIRLARRGDCVVITGKGHEQSLAFGKEEKEYIWSDQEEVKGALRRLKIA